MSLQLTLPPEPRPLPKNRKQKEHIAKMAINLSDPVHLMGKKQKLPFRSEGFRFYFERADSPAARDRNLTSPDQLRRPDLKLLFGHILKNKPASLNKTVAQMLSPPPDRAKLFRLVCGRAWSKS
jgi:hypothetical protein